MLIFIGVTNNELSLANTDHGIFLLVGTKEACFSLLIRKKKLGFRKWSYFISE